LAGCQSADVREAQSLKVATPDANPRFSILYTSARRLDVAPCGCSLNPLGGIDREWKLRQGWAKDMGSTLSLSAGTTFVPFEYRRANNAYYIKKADLLIQAFNAMGIEILTPAYEDFIYGQQQIASWRQATRATWTSANLYDRGTHKPIFPIYAEHEFGADRVTVIGVTSCKLDVPGRPDRTVECRPIVASLKNVFNGIGNRSDLTVVMGRMTADEVKTIKQQFPQVNLILNSDDNDFYDETAQVGTSVLYANPYDRGRAVSRFDFQGTEPIRALYSPAYFLRASARADDMRIALAGITAKMKGKLSAAERREVLKQQAADKELLDLQNTIANITPDKSMHFESETGMLSSDYSDPTNPMAKLLDQFRKLTHDQAVRQASQASE
jgi:hypothetical protein